jgi:DNA invertase Pin-like site-specific DNA recombinase
MRLLEFVVTRFASAIVEHGIDEAEARAEAEQFESAIRSLYGGRESYIHGPDLAARNARLLADFNDLLIRGKPIGQARDQVCTHYGIRRTTFYRILNARSQLDESASYRGSGTQP